MAFIHIVCLLRVIDGSLHRYYDHKFWQSQ